MQSIHGAFSAQFWLGLLGRALQGLLLAIPIAALFELTGLLVRRWALKQLAPTLARDQGRDPVERVRRRRQLRDLTVVALRWVWNTIALAVILTLWQVDPVAVALFVLSLVLLTGGLLKDFAAGYSLLLDDCLAPGDQVVIDGQVQGTVAELGLRRVRVILAGGGVCWVPNSAVGTVRNLSQSEARPPEEQ
ncbi:MAG: mechanosensitive ion channel family protein [Armatimonadetes bacterium]|nr:mechanosensitive ion channel family protein [Armatimonadota bacterium]